MLKLLLLAGLVVLQLVLLIFIVYNILFSGVWWLWFIIGSVEVIIFGAFYYYLLNPTYITY